MKLIDKGLLFSPELLPEGFSHASYPTGLLRKRDVLRVFFSSRNRDGKSSIFSADFHYADSNLSLVENSVYELIKPGAQSDFDKDGCSVGSVLEDESKIKLFYMGWSLQEDVPWRNSIGLATMTGDEFIKDPENPIIPISPDNPFTMSYPWVLKEGETYKCYYGSNLSWGASKENMDHVIKIAFSNNLLDWRHSDEPIISKNAPWADISRPSVIKLKGNYLMVYSEKNESNQYRLRFAISEDGIQWDDLPIELPDSWGAWANIEQAYGSLVSIENTIYVLYNGNAYGQTGFGWMQLKI